MEFLRDLSKVFSSKKQIRSIKSTINDINELVDKYSKGNSSKLDYDLWEQAFAKLNIYKEELQDTGYSNYMKLSEIDRIETRGKEVFSFYLREHFPNNENADKSYDKDFIQGYMMRYVEEQKTGYIIIDNRIKKTDSFVKRLFKGLTADSRFERFSKHIIILIFIEVTLKQLDNTCGTLRKLISKYSKGESTKEDRELWEEAFNDLKKQKTTLINALYEDPILFLKIDDMEHVSSQIYSFYMRYHNPFSEQADRLYIQDYIHGNWVFLQEEIQKTYIVEDLMKEKQFTKYDFVVKEFFEKFLKDERFKKLNKFNDVELVFAGASISFPIDKGTTILKMSDYL